MTRAAAHRPWIPAAIVAYLLAASAVGAGLGRLHVQRGWTPINPVGLFPGASSIEFALTLVLDAALLIAAQRLLGLLRTVLVFAIGGTAAVLAADGVESLLGLHGIDWAGITVRALTVNAGPGSFAAVFAASALAGPLWRRRIRLLGAAGVAVLLLYSGSPNDLARAFAAAIGLGLGMLFASRRHRRAWLRSTRAETRRLLACIAAIGALGPLIAVISMTRHGPLAPIALLLVAPSVPTVSDVLATCDVQSLTVACMRSLSVLRIASVGAIAVSALPLIGLLLAAWGMLRGKRFAVWFAAALNGLMALWAAFYFDILPLAGDVEPQGGRLQGGPVVVELVAAVAVPAASAALFLGFSSYFPQKPDVRTLGRAGAVVGGAALVLGGFYLIAGHALGSTAFTQAPTWSRLLASLPARFVPVNFLAGDKGGFLPLTPVAHMIYDGVGAVFWLLVVAGGVISMGSAAPSTTRIDVEQIRGLAHRGGDNRAHMVTWAGSSYWFAAQGGGIAYRVVRGVAVTVGGPVGPPEAAEETMAGFARFCEDQGWTAAFYAIDAKYAAFVNSLGWHHLVVGEDAVLALDGWGIEGGARKDIRNAVSRARREGLTLVWSSWSQLPEGLRAQLHGISEEWLGEKGLPELGFTLGGLAEAQDHEVQLAIVVDENRRVHAVTSWLPVYRDGLLVGRTLDLMRRRSGSASGAMEFAIAGAAGILQESGADLASLSVAPLARSTPTSNRLDAAVHAIARRLEPAYGFASLLHFKEKFRPSFQPVLLAYQDPAQLPRIAVAIVRAYLPALGMRAAARLLFGRSDGELAGTGRRAAARGVHPRDRSPLSPSRQ
ncbi:DUF2156 domain-containing protein [Gryllotalpicola sp.]|uniref:DUF2156 domain-containing protein n=1 Tax=Gryllotalpicola sp. TaxID=1932787 RepID=UPI002627DB95|nr:DUF2156 domain-containing protein [Gryllotalpicola sp.]